MHIKSTEYIGNYGAEGFSDEVTLLAMNANAYYGMVYALESVENQIENETKIQTENVTNKIKKNTNTKHKER